MRKLIVYSSLTGNTEKIANAINKVVRCDIFHINDAPEPEDYDLIILGFWVDKGHADAKTLKYMEKIKNKTVVPFYTLGAYPDSKHADDVLKDTVTRLSENKILGSFRCQGKIDPKLVEMMYKFPEGHPHFMNPERLARIEEAAKHPNQEDINNAVKFAEEIMQSCSTGVI